MKRLLQRLTDYQEKIQTSPPQAEKIHLLLIIMGIFLLLQDLLAENAKRIGILYSMIKYVDEAIPLLLFLLLLLSRIARGRLLQRTPIDLPLLLFLAVAVASSIATSVPAFIVAVQFLIYLKAFLVFYLLYNLPVSRAGFSTYLKVFYWVGVVFFLFGIVDLFFPAEFRRLTGNIAFIDYRSLIPSVKSLFIHPGVFGWFMSFLALYCFAFAVIDTRPAYFYSGLLFFLGCFLSMRARSIAGLVIAFTCGLFFVSREKRVPIMLLLLPVIIISIILLGPSITELFQSKIDLYVQTVDPLKIARNALYVKSFDVARDYFPFGAGMGRYGSYMSKVFYSPVYEQYRLSRIWGMSKNDPFFITDTFWPMIMGETGFLGFSFYLIVLILFLRMQTALVKGTDDPTLKAFHLGTFMIIIKSLVESIADPAFTAPPNALFILGAVGLSAAVGRMSLKTPLTR